MVYEYVGDKRGKRSIHRETIREFIEGTAAEADIVMEAEAVTRERNSDMVEWGE